MHFKTYKELLKTPEWRDKRQEILYRDKFICQKCGKYSKHNEVHHVDYISGRDIWNYPDNWLITLCRDCHDEEHNVCEAIRKLFKEMRLSGLFWTEIKEKINLKIKL